MEITRETLPEFITGSVTATGTPTALPSYRCANGVRLRPEADIVVSHNAGGGLTVAAGGGLSLPIDDSGKVYVSGSGTVRWMIV